jgi:cytochrome c oxidase cbb3-type subunit III
MRIKPLLIAGAVATLSWVAVEGSGQQNPQPPNPQPPAGQGRGGGGPNFPQQQRPPGDPAVIARGRALYGVNCTGCHGADLRGGDQGGPNLLRSEIVLTDEKGEKIGDLIRGGRRGAVGTMPALPLPDADVLAIAEYIHSVMGQAGRQGRPPERETPFELNVLVGDAAAGQVYFARACGRCHSPTGNLQGIATRVADTRALQNLWVSGGTSGRGGGRGGGGGGGGVGGDRSENAVTVTVTAPGSAPVTGRLVRIDDFIVTLVGPDGVRRTFRREGAVPKVEVSDPLEPHRRLVLELTDRDMHNVTAYLATLK